MATKKDHVIRRCFFPKSDDWRSARLEHQDASSIRKDKAASSNTWLIHLHPENLTVVASPLLKQHQVNPDVTLDPHMEGSDPNPLEGLESQIPRF